MVRGSISHTAWGVERGRAITQRGIHVVQCMLCVPCTQSRGIHVWCSVYLVCLALRAGEYTCGAAHALCALHSEQGNTRVVQSVPCVPCTQSRGIHVWCSPYLVCLALRAGEYTCGAVRTLCALHSEQGNTRGAVHALCALHSEQGCGAVRALCALHSEQGNTRVV